LQRLSGGERRMGEHHKEQKRRTIKVLSRNV